MAFIKFNDNEFLVQASVIPLSDTIVRIETETEPNLSGFVLYLDEEMNYPMSNDEYMNFTTLHRQDIGAYELSNDGSVWEESTPEVYIPTVTFVTMGGTLEGETEQCVENYEELIIPTLQLEEGYEFVEWTPEIPTEGKIEHDMIFYAVVEDKNIYFHYSGGGRVEGELKQYVEDYKDLQIPSPIADENYDFVGWMPEIPTAGIVETTNFYAVFKSNIPNRVETLENDLTDTQLGLVENFNTTVATAEEVTDCQVALVELYNLITGGV